MNIFNIPANKSFVDVLAGHFLKKYENNPDKLSGVLFLLPNRRACRELADAFVRARGGEPTMLPRIEPVFDASEDEILLGGNYEVLRQLRPSADKTERLFCFMRLLEESGKYAQKPVSAAQAYALAENLAELTDTVENEDLDFSRLKNIVSEEYAVYWQQVLKLLEIITSYWPEKLKQRGESDPAERRKQLLRAEIDFWKSAPERPEIVVAGTTAAFPVLKELVKAVADFDNGEVYLYGLDKYADDEYFSGADENHPQYELMQLLDYLHISRNEVMDLGGTEITPREKLISEIMRPATVSGVWRGLSPETLTREAFAKLHVAECDDLRQEAAAAALIIRETLETKGKTVALVTSDRNLSRMVVSDLRKWGIGADDSAGQPLGLTHAGIYLRLVAEAAEDDSLLAPVLTLMKYPFASCGMNHADFRRGVYKLEKVLRTSGLGLQAVMHRPEYAKQKNLLENFRRRLDPLRKIYSDKTAELKDIIKAHIEAAESIADTDIKNGGKIIWKNDDGRAAANFLSELILKSGILNKISASDYLPLLTKMMSGQNVRRQYGLHPRVKILGAIEARLTMYDRVIIGEVNEGTWPQLPKADMWMSRDMKKDFGLPRPEKETGVCAADFAHLLNAPEVFLTRARKIGGAPADKSRWLLRLETVAAAVFGTKNYGFLYDQPYSAWAKNSDRCRNPQPVTEPHPCPDVKYRPREISASQIEVYMRDPYSVYAKSILHLQPLNDADKRPDARDFGNIVHDVLKEFNDVYNGGDYPEDAADMLMKKGLEKFEEQKISGDIKAFWVPKLKAAVSYAVNYEKQCRSSVELVKNELRGEIKFTGLAGPFTVTARADRINKNKDGTLTVIDYKTGNVRSANDLKTALAPQLPAEAMIAQQGGFDGVGAAEVSSLQYWDLKKGGALKSASTDAEDTQAAVDKITEVLQNLINTFDNKNYPYTPKPVPGLKGQYGNYDHLSRIAEWSVKADDGGNNGGDND